MAIRIPKSAQKALFLLLVALPLISCQTITTHAPSSTHSLKPLKACLTYSRIPFCVLVGETYSCEDLSATATPSHVPFCMDPCLTDEINEMCRCSQGLECLCGAENKEIAKTFMKCYRKHCPWPNLGDPGSIQFGLDESEEGSCSEYLQGWPRTKMPEYTPIPLPVPSGMSVDVGTTRMPEPSTPTATQLSTQTDTETSANSTSTATSGAAGVYIQFNQASRAGAVAAMGVMGVGFFFGGILLL